MYGQTGFNHTALNANNLYVCRYMHRYIHMYMHVAGYGHSCQPLATQTTKPYNHVYLHATYRGQTEVWHR